jgi:hypothetical protein
MLSLQSGSLSQVPCRAAPLDQEGVTYGADTRQIVDPPTISRSHRHGNPPASGPRFGRAPISIHVHKPTGKRASEVQLRLSDVLRLGDVVPRVPFAMHRVAGWPSRGST